MTNGLTIIGDQLSGPLHADGSLLLNGDVTLSQGSFHLEDAKATVSQDHIDLAGKWLGFSTQLRGSLKEKALSLSGSANINFVLPDVQVGPITMPGPNNAQMNLGQFTLNSSFSTSADLSLCQTNFEAKIHEGNFTFSGSNWILPSFTLTEAPASIEHMKNTISHAIQSQAQTLFASLFTDVNRWLDALRQNLITGMGQVSSLLTGVYHISQTDMLGLLKKHQVHISETYHVDHNLPHHDQKLPHQDTPQKHTNRAQVHHNVEPKHTNHAKKHNNVSSTHDNHSPHASSHADHG